MSNMNKNTTHTIFQVGQKYPSCENGIWIDFKDDTFLFVIKDEIWTAEELNRLKTSDVTVSFIQKGIIDAFILEIFDCLEASDLPFYAKDGDTEFIEAIKSKNLFAFEIVFVSGNGEIVAFVMKYSIRKNQPHYMKDFKKDCLKKQKDLCLKPHMKS